MLFVKQLFYLHSFTISWQNANLFCIVLLNLNEICIFFQQDWDQVSAYSGRSIPRPRIYPMENQGIADDLRSHVSHFSGVVGKMNKQR